MPGKNLTRDEAIARAAIVSVDHYDVELDLTTSEKTFRTRTTVSFTSPEPGAATFIDLIAESVESITLNGEQLDAGVVVGQEQGHGVVVAGVAVEDDLRGLGRTGHAGRSTSSGNRGVCARRGADPRSDRSSSRSASSV